MQKRAVTAEPKLTDGPGKKSGRGHDVQENVIKLTAPIWFTGLCLTEPSAVSRIQGCTAKLILIAIIGGPSVKM